MDHIINEVYYDKNINIDDDYRYNINEKYNTLYVTNYTKYALPLVFTEGLITIIEKLIINSNKLIYTGYNWDILSNNVIQLNDTNNQYPIYIYTNYEDILPYDNTKIIFRILYNSENITQCLCYEFLNAALYMSYYKLIYNSQILQNKLGFIYYYIKFLYENQTDIFGQLYTIDKFDNIDNLVHSEYINSIINVKHIFYSRQMLTHILNNVNIDINKNDIINTIYTTYIQNNYKNIDRVLFIDTINEKITDYISQMGKLLLNN